MRYRVSHKKELITQVGYNISHEYSQIVFFGPVNSLELNEKAGFNDGATFYISSIIASFNASKQARGEVSIHNPARFKT